MNKLFLFFVLFFFLASYTFSTDEYFFTESGESRLHIFQNEQIAILSSNQDSILASSDGKYFSRSQYDKLHRLISKIIWENKGENSVIVSRLENKYIDNMSFPSNSTLIDYKKNELIQTVYSDNGLPKTEKNYIITDIDDFSKNQLKSEIQYEYNKDSLITQKTINSFFNNEKTKTEKFVYQTPGKEYAGYNYYVNGNLQRKIVYSSQNEYTDTSYFSSGQYVVAHYTGGRLIKEEFFSNLITQEGIPVE